MGKNSAMQMGIKAKEEILGMQCQGQYFLGLEGPLGPWPQSNWGGTLWEGWPEGLPAWAQNLPVSA